MGDGTNGTGLRDDDVVSRIVRHGLSVAEDDELEYYLRHYFVHVDDDDLRDRRPEDLFGLAADHAALGQSWTPGTVATRVLNPRVDVDGWESAHTVVMVVTDDLPFLVDSVLIELNRQAIGIHLVVHPVMLDRRPHDQSFADPRDHPDAANGHASFIAVEIDRQASPVDLANIDHNLQRVLGDVRVTVEDWAAMRDRMHYVADTLGTNAPVDVSEIDEAQELLRWMALDHFLFLGYRDYEIALVDGVEVLRAVPGSGLGILHNDGDPSPGRPIDEMLPAVREKVRERHLLNLTKAGSRSPVHRATYMDYVGIKTFDESGQVTGERRFLGLYTSEVYNRSVSLIPRVRKVVAEVIERAAFPPGGHDEKRLISILEQYPRDELFQMEADELYETALAIAGLQERRRVRLFVRRELFGRFVTCLVYLPRDRYNTSTRTGIEDLLTDTYGGVIADWNARITDSVLARLMFVVRVEEALGDEVTTDELEDRISRMIQQWDDDFAAELVNAVGEDVAVRLAKMYTPAFPEEYRAAFEARAAVADVHQLEALDASRSLLLTAYREPGHPASSFKLKIYRRSEQISLTSVMPCLTNLGVTVVDERPYRVEAADRAPAWIYDFSLQHSGTELDFARTSDLIESAFMAAWNDEVEDDGMNRLVLAAGMEPGEVAILRAYSRYLHQANVPYSQAFLEETLERHRPIARLLVDLFHARFDPDRAGTSAPDDVSRLDRAISEAIDAIASLDEDRVLRRLQNLIGATLRTSWFQRGDHGGPLPFVALKLDPTAIDDLPEPRPRFEIFVYSPRFEGVHLRAGAVARGGLRWSDRREDYRTEVLGLLKAQMVKNAVIVPVGAKGGFVLKRLPPDADRATRQAEVVACYQLFVTGLLQITDNLVDDAIVAPPRTVRYDGDDPYLVVAADKGTATFSDMANELAVERGFWLGDAFASGGSNGYDHKAMGITARGAWESVKRHFREYRRDIQTSDFTAVGIGDMSGDVFGNGMLQSRHTKLIAAFDHRHIVIDPDPDPERSYAERERLFALPTSSWADYDTEAISAGGGIYARTEKSIGLGPEARAALGTTADEVTPDELMSIILRAPVDLLWNGGIGTYVKASSETHAQVGDKANDNIRVDGRELRCLVVGEGGNLGVTQAGRVEFAANDGRIYTDAIDNAGGVDCSDHEVNIKILLDRVVADGDMTSKQRNELLEEMTSEVAMLVLTNNYAQTQALSNARVTGPSLADVHIRYLDDLVAWGQLDRALEHLPDTEELTERRLAGLGLTTPELAVLLAYTKNLLTEDLLDSTVPDDDVFVPLISAYFPAQLRDRFAHRIATHPLRREIVANRIANLVVDRAGTTALYRLSQEASQPNARVAAAHIAAWQVFQLSDLTDAVNALDMVLPADRQLSVHLAGRQLAERATRLLLRHRPQPFSAADAINDLQEPVAEAISGMPKHLLGADRVAFDNQVGELVAAGAPENLATRAAALAPSVAALDIVEIATTSSTSIDEVTAMHFAVADRLDLTWLRDRILALPRDSQYASLARLTLRGDLYTDHRDLTMHAVTTSDGADPIERVDGWIQRHQQAVDHHRQTIARIQATTVDLTTLLVASREVRNLIGRVGAGFAT